MNYGLALIDKLSFTRTCRGRTWNLMSDNRYNGHMFTRITINPRQMNGEPCVRGLRIPVATIVGMVAEDFTRDAILRAYPDLEAEDIAEALHFAAQTIRDRHLPAVSIAGCAS